MDFERFDIDFRSILPVMQISTFSRTPPIIRKSVIVESYKQNKQV